MSTITTSSLASELKTEELLAFLRSSPILKTTDLARGLFLLIKAEIDFAEWRGFALKSHRSKKEKEQVFLDCLELLKFTESECETFCNGNRNTQEQGLITLYVIAFSNFIKDPKKGGENGGGLFSYKSVNTTLNRLRQGRTYKDFIQNLCTELQDLVSDEIQEHEEEFSQKIQEVIKKLNSSIPFEFTSESQN